MSFGRLRILRPRSTFNPHSGLVVAFHLGAVLGNVVHKLNLQATVDGE